MLSDAKNEDRKKQTKQENISFSPSGALSFIGRYREGEEIRIGATDTL